VVVVVFKAVVAKGVVEDENVVIEVVMEVVGEVVEVVV